MQCKLEPMQHIMVLLDNNFDVIETLDSERSAKKIAEYNEKKIKKNNPKIYIQINIGQEAQKRGLMPSEFECFLKMCRERYQLKISGAMCLPPKTNKSSKYFNKTHLRKKVDSLQTKQKLVITVRIFFNINALTDQLGSVEKKLEPR